MARIIRRIVFQVLINCALVAAVFLGGAFLGSNAGPAFPGALSDERLRKTVILCVALVVSLPFLIAAYRKLHALSMLLAELAVKPQVSGQYNEGVRRVISEVIPVASMVGISLLIAALSSSILPPIELLALVVLIAAILAVFLWKWFVKLHARLQVALVETLESKGGDSQTRPS